MFEKWKRSSESLVTSGTPLQEKDLRCSFCLKAQADVRKLIAGPVVFICDECVEVCNDIIADDERMANALKDDGQVQEKPHPARPPKGTVACSLCGNVVALAELLDIRGRGALCGDCADAVEDALNQGRPMS